MKRFLALLLVAVAITVTVHGAPATSIATAQTSQCRVAEHVFGITRAGDLIVQPFCAVPGRAYLPARTLAAFGADVPRLFYGGQFADGTVFLYGLGADGALRWYRENPAGRLQPGVVVGSWFGDWQKYQHLQSSGGGDITGVDDAGRLWRWVHAGWRDGADTWAAGGPELDGPACGGTRPVFAGRDGPDRYVGVDGVAGYVFCGFDGVARAASMLPTGVAHVTMAVGPGVTYALRQGDHRLVRMILDTNATTPVWHTDSVAPVQFSTVFAGAVHPRRAGPDTQVRMAVGLVHRGVISRSIRRGWRRRRR